MPIGNGKSQVILQGFSGDDFIGIIVAECEFVGRTHTLEGNLRTVFEKVGHLDLLQELCGALVGLVTLGKGLDKICVGFKGAANGRLRCD